MVSGILYTFTEDFHGLKAQIAAKFCNSDVKVDPKFVFGTTNTSAEFKKHFPSGKVPAFETSSEPKLYLTEGNAIAYFVSNENFRGVNDFEKAEVLKWMNFADSDLVPVSNSLSLPATETSLFNAKVNKLAKEDLAKLMVALEKRLESYTYLVGERITLADISVFCCILNLFKLYFDKKIRNSTYPCTTRWFNTILNHSYVKGLVKDFSFNEKAVVEEPKSKKENVPKVAPKADAPKAAAEENGVEDEEPAAPKSVCPFSLLPAGTFKFDAFKRCYSNEDEATSVKYFWDNFDPENYSIWFCDYKFKDELKKVYMSCNLINGMFQRLEKMRSQSFASMCVFGTDDDNTVSGVWVWRGHDLAFKLSPDWQIDYESYDWKKLDPKSAEDKILIERYLKWEGTDKDGRKFNQGKIFK
uniref:eEF-1B gamma n=1 Tax=Cuerna arida TaxID=1464854 RepID=A0A1B6EN33_9HEMI